MRRQALVPIHHYFRRHDRRRAIVADLACGTGQFLTFLRDSQPGLRTLGIDLSLPYLAEARRRLARWPGAVLAQADAADMPLPDRSIDLVTKSEEHTSELQSLMRISYAVFCLKKKK